MDAPTRLALVTDQVQLALVRNLPTGDLRVKLDHAFAETLDALDAGTQDEDHLLYRFELVAGYGDLMRSLDDCDELAA